MMSTTISYAPRSYAPMTATTTAHASSTASAPMAAATTAAAAAEKHLLAERYKTKTCRNYLAQGSCPYETRCMFAHGDHELRTPEMNLRDGLVTEEAVKAFQRILNQRARGGSVAPTVAAAPLPAVHSSAALADDADETASVSASACSCPSCGYNNSAFASSAAAAPVVPALPTVSALDASVRKVFVSGGSAYRHEPYAPVTFAIATPHRIASPDNFAPRSLTPSPRASLYATCECDDCVAAAMRVAQTH